MSHAKYIEVTVNIQPCHLSFKILSRTTQLHNPQKSGHNFQNWFSREGCTGITF